MAGPIRIFGLLVVLALLATTADAQLLLNSSLENDVRVSPGGTYSGTIRVRNMSAEPRQITIYQQDASYTPDGILFSEPGTVNRSNAEWISFVPSSFTMAAGESATVDYMISVPRDQTLQGSYWSILMVETDAQPLSEAASEQSADRVSIQLAVKQRYAVQVAAHIEGTGAFTPGFDAVNISTLDAGERAMTVDIRNNGNRIARVGATVELYNREGGLVGKYESDPARFYPGSTRTQQFSFGTIPDGAYKALLILDAGPGELFGAEYDLQY